MNLVPLLYLSGSYCVSSCPFGYYGDNTNNQCVLCVSPCQTCYNSNYCLSCVASYSLASGGVCVSTCPAGYISISNVCTACNSPCATCNGLLSNCTSCITTLNPPMYLTNSYTCVPSTNCPSGYYANVSNYQCSACVGTCATCTSSLNCLTCISNYYLSVSTCILACLSNQTLINQICVFCVSPC